MYLIQNTINSQNAQKFVINSIAAGSIVASALIINSLIHSKTPVLSPIPESQNMVVSLLKKISEEPVSIVCAVLGYELGNVLFPNTQLPMRNLKVFCITVLTVGLRPLLYNSLINFSGP